ncbi:hypothetical protein ABPG75_013164 [Micractinium tetrahymenae]
MEIEKLSSVKAIAGVALPAVVLNAAPPITAAVQTALLGNYAPTAALAAYAAVSTAVGFLARVCNFLVDGVSSKVGRSAGARDWPSLATHVQLSMRWSALLGAAAVPLLLALQRPLCGGVLALSAEVQAAAAYYWVLRTWATPVQLLNMAAAGILQGFSRVRVNALLTSCAAVLEMLGSAAVLRWHAAAGQQQGGDGSAASLRALGWVTLGCQALLAAAALACIVALPPPEAQGHVHLLREVLGLGGGGGSSGSSGSGKDDGSAAAEQLQPLLDGQEAAEEDSLELAPSSPRAAAELHHRPAAQPEQQDGHRGSRRHTGAAGQRRSRPSGALFDEATREFLRDGVNMFIRSMTLQLTFFMALAAASRLGTAALAAHSIVGQLWVVVSYAVDGFAAAGIVLGSRLFAHARSAGLRAEAKRHMYRLTSRVLVAGAASGLAAGLAFLAAREGLISLFSSDPEVAAVLRRGAWLVLAAAQPLNGLLFVADGLMYATQQFRFVRNNMVLGFLLLFCPLLAAEAWLFPCLAAIWLAKAALNVWRLGGAMYLIFWLFMPRFGEEHGGAQPAGSTNTDGSGAEVADNALDVA